MLLKVDSLAGGYRRKNIVSDITFSLDIGDILCILGPNGCGKSTLIKLLLRFLPLKNGDIYIDNTHIKTMSRKQLARNISYIPQIDSIIFPYTALEIVTMGKTAYLNSIKGPSKEEISVSYQILKKLNISHLANKQFTKLSGGERQLVLIARALCQDAKILIMDEPTSSLDFRNQQLVLHTIKQLAKANKTIIFTTHSPQEPFILSTKVLLMSNGKITKFGRPNDVLTKEFLEDVFNTPIEIIKVNDRRLCFTI